MVITRVALGNSPTQCDTYSYAVYKAFLSVTAGYKRLRPFRYGYNRLQPVTAGYSRLQAVPFRPAAGRRATRHPLVHIMAQCGSGGGLGDGPPGPTARALTARGQLTTSRYPTVYYPPDLDSIQPLYRCYTGGSTPHHGHFNFSSRKVKMNPTFTAPKSKVV